jgi:carboxyl-terminal processing protease
LLTQNILFVGTLAIARVCLRFIDFWFMIGRHLLNNQTNQMDLPNIPQNNRPKKSPKTFTYALALLIVFVLGWESSSYYILNRNGLKIQGVDTAGTNSLVNFGGQSAADLSLFWKIWGQLGDQYVDETKINHQSMVYGAIKGMVSALDDPYTVFMTPDETKDFDSSLNGTLQGIGAELTVKDQALVVVSPIKNSPAEKAGILPGDIVYKIDGNLTNEMSLFDAISKIRGPKGSKVTLTLIRKSKDKPFDLAITRDEINIESVSMEDKGDGVYYVAINQFSDNTKQEFDSAVQKILLKDPKGIVLDLRFNGGGYLDSAVGILSDFLKGKKEAVVIKKRDHKEDETLYVTGDASLGSVPLVVLVNKGSASSSEIVAGAIQDHKRGLIMGEQTFGKGSVQEVDKMPDGSSLRITIAKWYTPNGRSISEVGITPDRIVPFTEADAAAHKDPQMDEAVKYLKQL